MTDNNEDELARSIDPATRKITVWPWTDAPWSYRKLSPHGGDEDWVAYVPNYFNAHDISWLSLLANNISEHEVPCGTVYIGAHA